MDSVLMPHKVKTNKILIVVFEEFDCGGLGVHELTIRYRYGEPCIDSEQCGDEEVGRVSGATIDIVSIKARVNDESPADKGIEISGMFAAGGDWCEDKLHNMIIDENHT